MRQLMTALHQSVLEAVDRRPEALRSRASELLAALAQDHAPDPARDAGGAQPADTGRLRAVFQLDDLDVRLLVAAAAPELDPGLAGAYGILLGQEGPSRLTAGLALELTGCGTLDAGARRRLSSTGPLVRQGLLVVLGDAPFPHRPLQVPDRVVAHLLGDDQPDPVVAAARVTAVPVSDDVSSALADAVAAGRPLAWVREPRGGSGSAAAAGALAELGLPVLAVDVDQLARPLLPSLRACAREAGLLGAGLVLVHADGLADEAGALSLLHRAAVPVLAVATRGWDAAWLPDLPFAVEAGRLPASARAALWQEALQDLGVPDRDVHALTALRLRPEEVVQVARSTRQDAGHVDAPYSLARLRDAARRTGGAVPGTATSRVQVGLDDLVLPPEPLTALRELVDWAVHRDVVLGGGNRGLAGPTGSGRGITALFAGGPGTGKTLAARVVAAELGLDLQTVDLSSVVDKYIGETEKNLERIFTEAESLNVVLFFDEADALFGNRGAVKEARDRYANQGVAYLLQRMEDFDGIAVLASNLQNNLDPAFTRRLQFVIQFPSPDAATRAALWEGHVRALGATDEADPVDVQALATWVEVSGGEVRNIVLAAAYGAAREGAVPGQRHLLAAVEREYRKLGRMLPERPQSSTGPDGGGLLSSRTATAVGRRREGAA